METREEKNLYIIITGVRKKMFLQNANQISTTKTSKTNTKQITDKKTIY
jgi:hypothetical protein